MTLVFRPILQYLPTQTSRLHQPPSIISDMAPAPFLHIRISIAFLVFQSVSATRYFAKFPRNFPKF